MFYTRVRCGKWNITGGDVSFFKGDGEVVEFLFLQDFFDCEICGAGCYGVGGEVCFDKEGGEGLLDGS